MKLALLLLLTFPIFADELDFNTHHHSGAALVLHNGINYYAAYQMDSFAVSQPSPTGLKFLFRIVLVPYGPDLLDISPTNSKEAFTVQGTATGHAVLATANDWRVEMIPIDPGERARNRSGNSGSNSAQVIVEVRRDAILLTFMDKE